MLSKSLPCLSQCRRKALWHRTLRGFFSNLASNGSGVSEKSAIFTTPQSLVAACTAGCRDQQRRRKAPMPFSPAPFSAHEKRAENTPNCRGAIFTRLRSCEATQWLIGANAAVLWLAPTVSAVPDVARRRLRRGTADAGCTIPSPLGWGECDNAGCRFSSGRSA